MRGLVKLMLAAGCLAAVGCSRPAGPVSLTHASVLAKAGLECYWQLPLRLPEDEKLQRLVLIEENLYCLTDHNTLIVVDAARGVRKWARSIAEPGAKVFPPCHAAGVALSEKVPGVQGVVVPPTPESMKRHDVVLFNTPDYVLLLDRDDGSTIRKMEFNDKPNEFVANTGGACDGKYYYVGSVSGRCYAIRINEQVIPWILYTDDILTAAPRCHSPGGSDRVFLAGEDGNYYVALAGDLRRQVWPPPGQRAWASMAGQVTAAFHVDDRACFIPCLNNRVYAFPLGGGEAIWKFSCKGPLFDDIQVSQNTVFQYAQGDKLYAINPANGSLRWAMRAGRRVLATMADEGSPTAYVVTGTRSLIVVDEILGRVRASIPLTGCDLFADNTTAPAIYVASRSGQIYCLRQRGAERLTAGMLMKGTPKPEPTSRPATTK